MQRAFLCILNKWTHVRNNALQQESYTLNVGDMKLIVATEADISHLMSWFPTSRSVAIWGGPNFRYPFTAETFFEDVCWQQIDSYRLVDPAGDILAFGQIYERHGHVNLARLVVSPKRRRQGIGKQLVALLMEKGRESLPLQEYSLYVCQRQLSRTGLLGGPGIRGAAQPRWRQDGRDLHLYDSVDRAPGGSVKA